MKYKLEHACIRVFDLEKSLKFYKEALGLEEVRRIEHSDYGFDLVYLSDENKNFEIELTYNYNPEKPYELGNGFSHFALKVEDLEASHKFHVDLGLEVGDLKGLPGTKPSFYFITDPDGYKIELIRG